MLGDAQPLTIKTHLRSKQGAVHLCPPECLLLLVFSKGDFRNLNIKQLGNKIAISATVGTDADAVSAEDHCAVGWDVEGDGKGCEGISNSARTDRSLNPEGPFFVQIWCKSFE